MTLNDTGKGISCSTVSQILRKSIQDAGLSEGFTARCFRSTAASAAVKGGVLVQTELSGVGSLKMCSSSDTSIPWRQGQPHNKMLSVHL